MIGRRHLLALLLLLLCLGLSAGTVRAQQYCPEIDLQRPDDPVLIGTKFSPPFVMGPKQTPEGLAIDLWSMIADCLELHSGQYRFVEYGTEADLIDGVAYGAVDLALTAIPISLENEKVIDFSYPYFETSLGAIIPDRTRAANFSLLIQRILQSNIVSIILGLFGFMVFVAIVYWWLERRAGNEDFKEGPFGGLYRALIWAALLVFQGEGDPFELKSRFGQISVLLLMLLGVTIVSSFTAVIASSLTLQALEPEVRTVADLEGKSVAVLSQSEAGRLAAEANVIVQQLQTFSQMQRYFDEDRIEVFIHEKEVLRYLINQRSLSGVKLSPLTLSPRSYAIVLPQGSALREPVNLSILAITATPVWKTAVQKYFGPDPRDEN